MRRLLVLFVFVLLCLPARGEAGTVFLIDGRGWGHGVGMSQYGARGYARAGWRYERILQHYYRGTKLQLVPARPVRVLLAEGKAAVVVSSSKPFKVVDARGKVRKLKPGRQRVVAEQAGAAALAAAVRRRRLAAPARRNGLPRRPARPPPRRHADRREHAAARPLPARRRALGDAGRLASAGSPRSGRRRALVRPRDAEAGHALRSLRRYAQPGLRRHPGGVGDDEPCDRRHRGQGARLERPRRDDLLPLDLGRTDGLDRRGVAEGDAGAVPRRRSRTRTTRSRSTTAGGRSC